MCKLPVLLEHILLRNVEMGPGAASWTALVCRYGTPPPQKLANGRSYRFCTVKKRWLEIPQWFGGWICLFLQAEWERSEFSTVGPVERAALGSLSLFHLKTEAHLTSEDSVGYLGRGEGQCRLQYISAMSEKLVVAVLVEIMLVFYGTRIFINPRLPTYSRPCKVNPVRTPRCYIFQVFAT